MIRFRTTVGMALAAILMLGLLAPSVASAHGDRHRPTIEITSGDFVTLPDGAARGYTIEGHAVMVRLPHRTLVAVHVRGLDASTTYPAHVHNAPCSAMPAGGGHYQQEPGVGPDFANDTNEIWPTVNTNRRGRGHGHAVHADRAREEAQSIVIHHPNPTSIRLACVDLT